MPVGVARRTPASRPGSAAEGLARGRPPPAPAGRRTAPPAAASGQRRCASAAAWRQRGVEVVGVAVGHGRAAQGRAAGGERGVVGRRPAPRRRPASQADRHGVEGERLGQRPALLVVDAGQPRLADGRWLHRDDQRRTRTARLDLVSRPGASARRASGDRASSLHLRESSEAAAEARLGVHRRRVHPQAAVLLHHQARVDRRREDPGDRRLRRRAQPRLPRSTRSPLRTSSTTTAGCRATSRRPTCSRTRRSATFLRAGRPDPGRAAEPQRGRCLRRRRRRGRRGRVRRRLPRGHASPATRTCGR